MDETTELSRIPPAVRALLCVCVEFCVTTTTTTVLNCTITRLPRANPDGHPPPSLPCSSLSPLLHLGRYDVTSQTLRKWIFFYWLFFSIGVILS